MTLEAAWSPKTVRPKPPLSRVLFVVYERRAHSLAACGCIAEESADIDLFDRDDSEWNLGNGVYVAEGEVVVTRDYFGEYDESYEPSIRPATTAEWLAHLNGEYVWDDEIEYRDALRVYEAAVTEELRLHNLESQREEGT